MEQDKGKSINTRARKRKRNSETDKMNITWLFTLARLKEEHLWLSSQSGGILKHRGEIPGGNDTICSVKETFFTMRQNGEDECIIIRMIQRGRFFGYPPYLIFCYVVVDSDLKL